MNIEKTEICGECGVTEVCKHNVLTKKEGVVICGDCGEPNPKALIVYIREIDDRGFKTKIVGAKRMCKFCFENKDGKQPKRLMVFKGKGGKPIKTNILTRQLKMDHYPGVEKLERISSGK